MAPIHIYLNWRFFLRSGGAMLLALTFSISFYKTGSLPLFWASVTGFFTLATLLCLWLLADRRPYLTLSAAGLTNRFIGVGLIEWGDVERVYLRQLHVGALASQLMPQHYVCLQLRNEAEYLARMSFWNRLRWASVPGITRFHVNTRALQSSASEIMTHIAQCVEAYSASHNR